ncbi:MAG: fumarylacetoacetate hydrolase family protein [Lentisphaeria bacterium]|nr:fumarylacetoacetate hydrolase family protein [Lentisphaeria bacterium]
MKLVTFVRPSGQAAVGALSQHGRIADLAIAASRCSAGERDDFPASMLALVEAGDAGIETAGAALTFALERDDESISGLWHEPGTVPLLAPLPRPRSFRDFWGFEEHVKTCWQLRGEAVPDTWYELPIYYKGNRLSIIGPDEDVCWPSYTEKLDYELELGIIIGKQGRDIHADDADSHIFGYTALNDWSARDIQRREMACRLGPAKGKDFATSIGPCIVTADEVDPYDLQMIARINGEVWTDNHSGTIYHRFNQCIAHASMDETLYPGELFGSGTVGRGCGLELDRWLQPGDVVELEIENIGILRNRVIKKG